MARGLVLSFVVLLAVIEFGSCLKCYMCTNAALPGSCGEKFSATQTVKDCDNRSELASFNRNVLLGLLPSISSLQGPNEYCLTITDFAGVSTGRTCVYAQNEQELKHLCDASKSALKTCNYCSKDLCNGSSAIVSSIPIALLALVATYLFYKQ